MSKKEKDSPADRLAREEQKWLREAYKRVPRFSSYSFQWWLDSFGLDHKLTSSQKVDLKLEIEQHVQAMMRGDVHVPRGEQASLYYVLEQFHTRMNHGQSFESAWQKIDWPDPENAALFVRPYTTRTQSDRDMECFRRAVAKVRRYLDKHHFAFQEEVSRRLESAGPIRRLLMLRHAKTLKQFWADHAAHISAQLAPDERSFLPKIYQMFGLDVAEASVTPRRVEASMDQFTRAVRRWADEKVADATADTKAALDVIQWNCPLRRDSESIAREKTLLIH